MKGILISPFNSTNSLHNFLFTKQFINHIDACIFLISNDNKNNKEIFQKFIQTLKIHEQPNIILHHFQIFPHSIHDTIEILHNQVHPIIQKLNPTSILLNISCNNEIISTTLFDQFKSKYHHLQAYSVIPSKNSYVQLHPQIIPYTFTPQIKLHEFFEIHGYEYYSTEYKIPQNCPTPEERLKKYEKNKSDHPLINSSKNFTSEQKEYLTGGWLELFIYNKISKIKDPKSNQPISKTRLGIKIKIKNTIHEYTTKKLNSSYLNDHEIDVAFILNNHLHLIECKAHTEHQKLYDAMYKLSSLQKIFPHNTKSFIFALTKFSPTEGNIEKEILSHKKDLLGITNIATLKTLKDDHLLTKFLEENILNNH